ncbi:MAG TPA: hemolysin family protein [Candidatus Saccharimonadales bacterium]|nr:hemolysin family protein [Candidatus Saccharimonadales bacterium]
MGIEIGLLIGLTALLGNAFFVGAEFGLISARRSSIEIKAHGGSRRAKATLKGMEDVSMMLAGAQLGITVCSLVLGAVAEPVLAHILEEPFHAIGIPDLLLHPVSFVIALTLTVYLHVVIGEMVPKNIALAKPDRVALALTPMLLIAVKVLQPIVNGFNVVANQIIRMLGVKPMPEIASAFTRDEVEGFVKESRREGLITSDEETLVSGALSFGTQKVTSVLLPLKNLVTIDVSITASQLEELSAKTGYSRFPVVGKNKRLRGYLHVKDILNLSKEEYSQPIPAKLIRKLTSVRDHTSLGLALRKMQSSGTHISLVEDKAGKVLGVVYLEDVLEELVGEIHDASNRR